VRGAGRFVQLGKATLRTGSVSAARLCSRWGIPPRCIVRRGSELWLEPLRLPLETAASYSWLLEGFMSAAALCASGGRLRTAPSSELILEIGSLTLQPRSAEDLFTLDEVFVRNTYAWTPPAPTVVLDIGMNVGFASLALASRPEVVAVYGYEPFAPTYALAMRNLAMNGSCASKIRPHNLGVAATDETRRLEYTADRRGSVGVFSLPAASRPVSGLSSEPVELVRASAIVDKVKADFPNLPVAAKIDCEGAEYQIVAELAGAGRLQQLSALMIEWHRRADQSPAI
jgi:FkbM family methyltransferase